MTVIERLCKQLHRACEDESAFEILDYTAPLDVLACILLAVSCLNFHHTL